jgi:hypothetical protein
MKTSETINEIATALAKAQASMGRAKKDATNPHFGKSYADLDACWDACQEPLTSNGIAVIQANKPTENGVTIETRLIHSSGQWIQDEGLFVPASKIDAQGFGSAETYCRRYALCAMVGIAPDDDDGNAAAQSAPKRQPAKSPAKQVAEQHGMKTADELQPSALYKAAIEKITAAVKAGDVNEIARIMNVAGTNHEAGHLSKSEHSGITNECTMALKKIKAAESEPVAA